MATDHNVKRANLIIDVCGMFAVTNRERANGRVKNCLSPCARDGEVTKNSLSRREHRTDINTEFRSLSIMVS